MSIRYFALILNWKSTEGMEGVANEAVEKAYFAFRVTGESPTFQPENGWTGLEGFR